MSKSFKALRIFTLAYFVGYILFLIYGSAVELLDGSLLWSDYGGGAALAIYLLWGLKVAWCSGKDSNAFWEIAAFSLWGMGHFTMLSLFQITSFWRLCCFMDMLVCFLLAVLWGMERYRVLSKLSAEMQAHDTAG